MSLLDELQSLDLSPILDARASISVAVAAPDLRAVVEGGAAQTALAEVGAGIESLRTALDSPATLIGSLTGPLTELAGSLDLTDLPAAGYLDAVREGATIVAGLVEGLSGDPAALGRLLRLPLEDAIGSMTVTLDGFGRRASEDLGRLRALIDEVERGIPTDPAGFAHLAIRVLLPMPQGSLTTIRGGLDGLLAGVSAIALPTGRTSGLVLALDAVATAAASGDGAALERALRELPRVRAATVAQIEADLRAFQTAVGGMRLGEALAPLATAAAALRTGEQGLIELFAAWRAELAEMRLRLEAADESEIDAIAARIVAMIEAIETAARTELDATIEARVRQAEEWVRSLLRHLRLRELRAELSAFFAAALTALQAADLDRPARELRAQLADLRQSIEAPDLGAGIREALEDAKAAIDDALDAIIEAVDAIGEAVEELAEEAAGILDRAAAELEGFASAVAEIRAEIDNLGIEQATQQVIDQVEALQAQTETVLAKVELPEPLRPVVERAIAEVEAVDLEAVIGAPVRRAVDELSLPGEVIAAIRDVLQRADATLKNLIPTELIASIEAEIDAAMAVVRDFDPAGLVGEVTGLVEEAAGFVEALNPRSLVEEVSQPFQRLLDLVDAAHPRVLLAPVLDAYDDLLGAARLPQPQEAVEGTLGFVGGRGEAAAQAMAAPIERFVGDQAAQGPGADAAPAAPALPAPFGEIRPGDVIRLVGSLPAQLRDHLAALDEAAAQAALGAVNALCGGLAADLRRLPAALWEIETRLNAGFEEALAPLAVVQLEAGLAIQAGDGAGSIDVAASIEIVGSAAPDALRADLAATLAQVRGTVERAAGLATGGADGAALQVAATLLERSPLAAIGDGLDGLLAALDPEPIAAELDALAAVAFTRVSTIVTEREAEIRGLVARVERLLAELNPVARAQKFLRVLEVLREELDLLNPHRLADELAEIHAAIRADLAAYDPAAVVEEVGLALDQVVAQLRALDPAALLGDLSFLDETVARVEEASPAEALAGVGASLAGVGERLAAIDPAGLLEAIESLGPRVLAQVEVAMKAVQRAIVALLEALRFAGARAGVSVRVSVGGGAG